jgi:hypothetical protein
MVNKDIKDEQQAMPSIQQSLLDHQQQNEAKPLLKNKCLKINKIVSDMKKL